MFFFLFTFSLSHSLAATLLYSPIHRSYFRSERNDEKKNEESKKKKRNAFVCTATNARKYDFNTVLRGATNKRRSKEWESETWRAHSAYTHTHTREFKTLCTFSTRFSVFIYYLFISIIFAWCVYCVRQVIFFFFFFIFSSSDPNSELCRISFLLHAICESVERVVIAHAVSPTPPPFPPYQDAIHHKHGIWCICTRTCSLSTSPWITPCMCAWAMCIETQVKNAPNTSCFVCVCSLHVKCHSGRL